MEKIETEKEWVIPTGTIRVTLTSALCRDPDSLLGAGARQNPKRPFVFVSRVLGKHIPCPATLMRTVQDELVAELAKGPAVIIGMAETATGLGEGVFAAYLRAGGAESLYLSTTRYPIDGCEKIEFSESHSHATRLVLHTPQSTSGKKFLQNTKRLILVDDELSTGATFVALLKALRPVAPSISEIDLVTLTDFSGGAARDHLSREPGIRRVDVHAQLTGRYRFEAGMAVVESAPPAQREVSCRRHLMIDDTPRLGITEPLTFQPALIEHCADIIRSRAPHQPAILVATGEFMYAAQLLGERLEEKGLPTLVQSTTRSPLMVGGAIKKKRTLPDPYGEGIDNHMYNFNPGDAPVFLIHETGMDPLMARLCRDLQAISVDIRQNLVTEPLYEIA